MATALSTLGSHRPSLGHSRAAGLGPIKRLLSRLSRPVASGPRPLDLALLSPHWLRDLGLPEDYGRPSYDEGLVDWTRLERRR